MAPLLFLSLLLSFLSVPSRSQTSSCLAPSQTYTFYVTFHQDISNIYHYDQNGAFLGTVFPNTKGVSELRGMLLYPNGNLIVANADSSDSKLLIGDGCGTQSQGTLTSKDLSHPYGVCSGTNPVLTSGYPDGTAVVYATNQNSLRVSYYVMDPTLSTVEKNGYFGPDNFFVKIRGSAVDPATQQVIVADEGANITYFLDANGQIARTIKVSNPIGTYVSDGILYISSNDDSVPAVYAYNLSDSLRRVATYQTPIVGDLSHPCGIGSCGDDLLVLSQNTHTLRVFSKSTTKYLRTIISGFGDDPEQLIVLNCQYS